MIVNSIETASKASDSDLSIGGETMYDGGERNNIHRALELRDRRAHSSLAMTVLNNNPPWRESYFLD